MSIPSISAGSSAASNAQGGNFTGGGISGDFSPSIGGAKSQSLTTIIVAAIAAIVIVAMLWRPKKRK